MLPPNALLFNQYFCKTTRRGSVLKIAREHYLRDDICCGAAPCPTCTSSPSASKPLLQSPGILTFVDAVTAVRQIAFLENEAVKNVVLTLTLINDIKKQTTNLAQRFLACTETKDKQFFVFLNEHCRSVFPCYSLARSA